MKGPYTCIDRLIANSPIPPSVPGRLARVTGTVAGGRALKQPAGCTESGPNPSTSSRISTREQQSHARELSKWHSVLAACVWGKRDTNGRNIIRKKNRNELLLPIKIPRTMTSKGLVSKEIESVWLSLRLLSHLLLALPGISQGHVRMCLFPALFSHSRPLHSPSCSFSNFYPLPDTESLPGNQSSLGRRLSYHTNDSHPPESALSSFLDHYGNSSVVFGERTKAISFTVWCFVVKKIHSYIFLIDFSHQPWDRVKCFLSRVLGYMTLRESFICLQAPFLHLKYKVHGHALFRHLCI